MNWLKKIKLHVVPVDYWCFSDCSCDVDDFCEFRIQRNWYSFLSAVSGIKLVNDAVLTSQIVTFLKASLCRASFVGSQHDATRICRWALASASLRRLLSIDIACQKGAQQQTRRPPLLLATDERTDGRTPERYIDPAPHDARATSTASKRLLPRDAKHPRY